MLLSERGLSPESCLAICNPRPSYCYKLVAYKKKYISETAWSYRIDKICKHFGGVLQGGHEGTDPKYFSRAMSKVHLYFSEQKEILKPMPKIEDMSSSTEQALTKSKSNKVLQTNLRTLYVCAKQNFPPNNELESLLRPQRDKTLDSTLRKTFTEEILNVKLHFLCSVSEIGLSENQQGKSEKIF